jgi:hypothetical protein
LIHARKLSGNLAVKALFLTTEVLREMEFKTFEYKPMPIIYQKRSAQNDLWVLWQLDFKIVKRDMSNFINLVNNPGFEYNRKQKFRKINIDDFNIFSGKEYLSVAYDLINNNLNARHNINPVHTKDDLLYLVDRFPDEIAIHVIEQKNDFCGSAIMFNHGPASIVQIGLQTQMAEILEH